MEEESEEEAADPVDKMAKEALIAQVRPRCKAT